MRSAAPVVLVCTVGGSPEPLRKSICHYRPSRIVYVASPETRGLVRSQIEEGLEWRADDTEICTLENCQNLLQCVKDMRKQIASSLRKMSLTEDVPLIADITGGTKIMSAALALVMMEYKSRFSYVGGSARTKGGVGIVESGSESVGQEDNPWDVLALREVQALARAFNHAQFAEAMTIAQELGNKMNEGSAAQKFYRAIAGMVNGYMLWDSFAHDTAHNLLRQANQRLIPFAKAGEPLADLLQGLESDVERLNLLRQDAVALRDNAVQQGEQQGRHYLLDLLGNAQRCADAGRFDDAVARIYSAIEKYAKATLWARYGIDNGHVAQEQLPVSLREEWRPLLDEKGVVRVGLERSYQLLDALGDPVGNAFVEQGESLKETLQSRNKSLLAHGYVPIGKDKYAKLMTAALEFLKTDLSSLPTFLRIDWRALLL